MMKALSQRRFVESEELLDTFPLRPAELNAHN